MQHLQEVWTLGQRLSQQEFKERDLQPARAQNWERVNRSLYHVARGDSGEDLDDLCEEFDPENRSSVREVMALAKDFLEQEDAGITCG